MAEIAVRINNKLKIRDLELVKSIVEQIGPTFLEVAMEGKEVHITNFCRFFAKYIQGMHNPQNMQPLPPMYIPKFIPSKIIREKIKSKRADYFLNENKKEIDNP